MDVTDLGRDRRKSFLPGGRAYLTVLADVRPVEALRAQAVDDMARAVTVTMGAPRLFKLGMKIDL